MQRRVFKGLRGWGRPLLVVGSGFALDMLLWGLLGFAVLCSLGQPELRGDSPIIVHSSLPGNSGAWLEAFSACVMAPLGEELLFRGAVFLLLLRLVGKWPACVLSSIVFGAVHLSNPGTSTVCCVLHAAGALVYCAIYIFTGRLRWCVLSHALWNIHTTFFLIMVPPWGTIF